ncbi:MAG TPA: sulfite exporter TauE/SafE family protein, partial [Elusimicrobiales bacterium]|nr:sulfite exporter TauE/SafE family protein [Elusimicrobiales bacterium]
YFLWGLFKARGRRLHEHNGLPPHSHGLLFKHSHAERGAANMTPWVLFTLLVFGPCEPLIPLLLYPAASSSLWSAALVCAVFSVATIATMLTVIMLSYYQLSRWDFSRFERYSHAAAGFALMACGGAVVFLGL